MSNPFKVGDKVVALVEEDSDKPWGLIKGKVYTVLETTNKLVRVYNPNRYGWFYYRFELYKDSVEEQDKNEQEESPWLSIV
jgi:hypothetical protein